MSSFGTEWMFDHVEQKLHLQRPALRNPWNAHKRTQKFWKYTMAKETNHHVINIITIMTTCRKSCPAPFPCLSIFPLTWAGDSQGFGQVASYTEHFWKSTQPKNCRFDKNTDELLLTNCHQGVEPQLPGMQQGRDSNVEMLTQLLFLPQAFIHSANEGQLALVGLKSLRLGPQLHFSLTP